MPEDDLTTDLANLLRKYGLPRVLSALEVVAIEGRDLANKDDDLFYSFQGWENVRYLLSAASTTAAIRGLGVAP